MNKKIVVWIAIFCLGIIFQPRIGMAQTSQNNNALEQARTLYANGKFEQAQSRLLALLKTKNLQQDQQLQALILLAEIRRAMLDEDGARKLIDKILDIKPDFTPSATDYPPNFIALVQAEKEKRSVHSAAVQPKNKSFFTNSYFWIGLGGTAAATTAIILGAQKGNGGKKKTLPLPPDWPEGGR